MQIKFELLISELLYWLVNQLFKLFMFSYILHKFV
jgi:hypothetical protein